MLMAVGLYYKEIDNSLMKRMVNIGSVIGLLEL